MTRLELVLATWLCCLCLFAASSAAEQAATESVAEPPVLEDGPAQPSFMLRPSSATQHQTRTDPETGDTVLIAVTLRELLGQAHGVHPRDVRAEGEIELSTLYDVILRPGPGSDRAKTRMLLAAGLARTLRIEVARAEDNAPVNRLQRVEGDPALARSKATEPHFEVAAGRVEARGVPLRDLAHFLRWHSPRPILDETGLDARYDFVIEWDPEGGPRALFLSLNDLGLQIVRGRDLFPLLLVSPAP